MATFHGADVHAGIDRNRCIKSSYQDTVAQIGSRYNIDLEEIAGVQEHGNEVAASK